ncbi:MAG: YbjN domain-containing protein [Chitinophagaceae bacterium]|nr:YbjN domain-containing protein [Chitinophagaceae bacterium]
MQNTIKNTLESNDFIFQTLVNNPNQTVYKLGIQLENGRADTYIDIRSEAKQVLIFTVCPNNVPANHRNRISEFITRANRGLPLGNFELDYDDGELRCKSCYIYDDTFPNSEDVFMRNLYITFNLMDRYLPGIMSVIFANVLPNDAISQIENVVNPTMN